MSLKDAWFVPDVDAFPMGLFLLGEIQPVTEFSADRSAPKRQRVDLDNEGNGTGKRLWKGIVTDPSATTQRAATFEVTFVADHQPVPSAPEVARGMRPIELEGLRVKPRMTGEGQFRSISYLIRATGIVGDNSGAKKAA